MRLTPPTPPQSPPPPANCWEMEFMETSSALGLDILDFEARGMAYMGNYWYVWRLSERWQGEQGPAWTWP